MAQRSQPKIPAKAKKKKSTKKKKRAASKKSEPFSKVLETKTDEIQSRAAEIAREVRKNERAQNRLTELQRLDAERRQSLSRYDEALKKLQTDIREVKKYHETKSRTIDAELNTAGLNKADIQRIIEKIDGEIAKGEEEVVTRKQELDDAKEGHVLALTNRNASQQTYSELLKEQQLKESLIVELRDLSEQIDKEQNVKRRSFLITELGMRLRAAKVTPPPKLANRLGKGLEELLAANEAVDEEEDKFNEANEKARLAEARVEALKKNRRAEILNKL